MANVITLTEETRAELVDLLARGISDAQYDGHTMSGVLRYFMAAINEKNGPIEITVKAIEEPMTHAEYVDARNARVNMTAEERDGQRSAWIGDGVGRTVFGSDADWLASTADRD